MNPIEDATTFTSWLQIIFAVCIVPSVAWLVREVLSLRGKMIRIEAEIAAMTENCRAHKANEHEIFKTLHRLDRNIVRLCSKMGIEEDSP